MQTHEQYNGIFLPRNSQHTGILNISEENSSIKIIGKDFLEFPESECTDIHGMLIDGKKASLLGCVLNNKTRHHSNEQSQFESQYFPNHVVIGEEFINSGESVIQAVHYHFDNVNRLVSGHDTFQSLNPSTDEILHILEEDHKRREMVAEKYGWMKSNFKPQICDHPQLLYFSGLWEITACETKLGKVSLTNRASRGLGTSTGISISNEVTVNIEFTESKTLDEAIDAMQTLHGLFELSLGHRQRYRWIELKLINQSKETEYHIPQTARLYWSLCNTRVKGESKVGLNDILLAPDLRPKEFTKVVAGWMNSADIMSDPRERFGSAFFENYSINRIVGAANMFDLLPESYTPKTKEIDAPLMEVVEQCRNLFTSLPESFAKQSILSALGRLGKASLRDKIYHRADKISAEVSHLFPDLYIPCNHAVIARNHYVHGSNASFDYQENFTEFAFIIDTLEFVFAVSDLLDIGWDLKIWLNQHMSMTHPFGIYAINYSNNINRLKNTVKKQR